MRQLRYNNTWFCDEVGCDFTCAQDADLKLHTKLNPTHTTASRTLQSEVYDDGEAANDTFKIALFGDTQSYSEPHPDGRPLVVTAMIDWVIANAAAENILFTSHMGDMTDRAGVVPATQWSNMTGDFSRLPAAGLPMSICPGNHDYPSDTSRDLSLINSHFPLATYSAPGSYLRGVYSAGLLENTWWEVERSGNKIIILSLELAMSDDVIAWARAICQANSSTPVVVMTHGYLNADNLIIPDGASGDPDGYVPSPDNSAPEMRDKFFYLEPNVKMLCCGHRGFQPLGATHVDDTAGKGSPFHVIGHNQQYISTSLTGHIRLIEFNLEDLLVDITSYSPYENLGVPNGFDAAGASTITNFWS